MNEESKRESNKSCQVCHGYLFDDDDVVVCPICGAPYHRDCYETVGHCVLEEFHGTDKQYTPPKPQEETVAKKCSNCGHELEENTAFCSNCGKAVGGEENGSARFENSMPNGMPFVQVFNVDFCGGVPKHEDIGGITAEEAAKSIKVNSPRYVRKFYDFFKNKKSVSWNWAAFLFPSWWMFYRKMYLQGILFFVIKMVTTLCSMPLMAWIYSNGISDSVNYMENASLIMDNMSPELLSVFGIMFVGLVISLIAMVVAGVFGDKIYYGTVLNRVKKIKKNDQIEDKNYEILRTGGTNMLVIWVLILAENYLPSMLLGLFLK